MKTYIKFCVSVLTILMLVTIAEADCPPNGITTPPTEQPPYTGGEGGAPGNLSGWREYSRLEPPPSIEVWCIDPDKNPGNGDEQYILFVGGKPVGRCPSNNGYNEWGIYINGTYWYHWEDRDPNETSEWTPGIRDDWEYSYLWGENISRLIINHTYNGVPNHTEWDGPPPEDPFNLPPSASNTTRSSSSVALFLGEFNEPLPGMPHDGYAIVNGPITSAEGKILLIGVLIAVSLIMIRRR